MKGLDDYIVEIPPFEDWEGVHFDCYDVPFIVNFATDENNEYERRYVFNDLSLFTRKRNLLLDKYWFGGYEDAVRRFVDLCILPPIDEIDDIVIGYLCNIAEGLDLRPIIWSDKE